MVRKDRASVSALSVTPDRVPDRAIASDTGHQGVKQKRERSSRGDKSRHDLRRIQGIGRQALREVTRRRCARCDSTRIGPFASVGSIHEAFGVTIVRDDGPSLSIV